MHPNSCGRSLTTRVFLKIKRLSDLNIFHIYMKREKLQKYISEIFRRSASHASRCPQTSRGRSPLTTLGWVLGPPWSTMVPGPPVPVACSSFGASPIHTFTLFRLPGGRSLTMMVSSLSGCWIYLSLHPTTATTNPPTPCPWVINSIQCSIDSSVVDCD